MRRIVLPYRPRPQQAELHRAMRSKRFSVLVCHRRFGKTILAINRLIRAALASDKPDWRGGYIAPLFKQAKAVAWDYLKYYAGRIEGAVFNEADLRVDIPSGQVERDGDGNVIQDSRVKSLRLYGANNPDALRGIYLDGVVFDEVAQMPRKVWTQIVRPALADRKGWALFIGTPQGRDYFHELYSLAQHEPGWLAAMYKASETGILDPEELEAARREMSPEEYEQEFECSFTAAIRGAYFAAAMAEAERSGRITDVPYDPTLPVHTAWDLGVSDSTCIWFVQARPGGAFAAIDFYEASGEGLPHYVQLLNSKPYTYGVHIAPHDIRVRELGTGKSRLEMAASLGVRFRVCPQVGVQDGIDAVRVVLPRVWFDRTRCATGIEALTHYRREFNDRMGDFKDRPLHDWTSHATDAFRYFAVGFRPDRTGPRQTKTVVNFDPFRRDERQARAVTELWRT